MHSTRTALLKRQADELGLPLELVLIPADCSNEVYEEKMQTLIKKAQCEKIGAMGFGDLFLTEIREYRERQLAGTGIEAVFPLWGTPTAALAQEICSSGIEAVLTCVDPRRLPASFVGRYFDPKTISEFPSDVDPCGENGEFHSFVFSSPNFNRFRFLRRFTCILISNRSISINGRRR